MIGDIMQPNHLLFVFVIALLVLGPKRLPEVGRQLGNGIRGFRAAISGEHTEDEDHDGREEDDVLAPADEDSTDEPTPFTAPAGSHVADETVTHADTPAEHELAGSTIELSTLPSDHQFGTDTSQPAASPAEHEFGHDTVEQSTLRTDHDLSSETVEPPTAPIEPAAAQVRPDPAPGNGVAAESSHTAGGRSVATEATEPAENESDRVA